MQNEACREQYFKCPQGSQNGGPSGTFTIGGNYCAEADEGGQFFASKSFSHDPAGEFMGPDSGYTSACCLCKKGAIGSPTSQWTQDSVCKWCGENETTVTVGASQCLPCPFGTATLQGGQCHQGPQQYPPCGVCCKPAKEGMKRDVHATNECKFIPQNTTVSTN